MTRFLVEILRAKDITPTVVADARCVPGLDRLAAREGLRGGRSLAAARSPRRSRRRAWARGRCALLATGAPEVAAALAGPRATLTVLAPAPALPGELVAREVTVIGIAGPHPDLIVEAAAMCVKGEIDLAGGVGDGPAQARVDMF